MEKTQLINFVAKVMEESGFKVYKNFKTSTKTIDIYAVLPTNMGDFGIVMECNNYDKRWEVGIDILKEMEKIAENLNSSKIAVVTTSYFSNQAINYANKKNIKLINGDDLLSLAKKYSNKNNNDEVVENTYYDAPSETEYAEDDLSYLNQDYNNDYYEDNYDDFYSTPYVLGNQNNNSSNKSLLGNFNSKKGSNNHPLVVQRQNQNNVSFFKIIRPYLNNTIFLIVLVVLVSYLLSLILGVIMGLSSGIIGLIEMITSLLLSYGLVFISNREGLPVLIKGSIVFFVSLIILTMLIIVL